MSNFGIMMYELVSNKPLFEHQSGDTIAKQIITSILSADLLKEVDDTPEPYQSVIKKYCVADAWKLIKKNRK
ncbi:hypothetical protein OGI71_11995 [Sphingobacterium sp. ML3W]|uniref:hypothetical protein n=2 Tax=Sphingobacterium sp. ML3W TaxID=1538644 RepID=UPI00249AFE3D|nr:hypothetical protein [Sphingobacterium sp. ML3W]WFA82017.1 hypothetical protein OGI71_11995 [Sphingobacterium sp. ML3W]